MYSTQDSTQNLEEFARRASRYRGGEINLNGKVTKHDSIAVRGGYATVFRGVLNPTGRRVAIKTARGGLPGDEETINRILREVHLWSKLHHENILPLLGITTDFDFTMSIVSPWMERGDARRYVKDIAIDPRPLIEGIARGLLYLHDLEPGTVFHGDLKGANVLMSDDGRPLLADFGFSYLTNSSFSVPLLEEVGGTLRWMAPEMFDSASRSAEADVWSFGMTALELFTRRDPFHRFRGRAVMSRIMKGPPDRPTDDDTCFRMTEEWWRLLCSCWRVEPQSRPTISRVIAMIDSIKRRATRTTADVDAALVQPFQGLNMHNNLPGPPVPPSSFPAEAGNQRTVNTVTIFTSKDNPLLTSVEVEITLVPDDTSGMYRSYWPIVWRTLSFPAHANMHHVIEIPDVVGVSTITDKGDGVFVCVNRTTVTASQQRHEFTFKNNRWESRLNMSIPPNVVRMENVCGKSDAFAACAITANHGAEPILHLGTLTNGNSTTFKWPIIFQAYVYNQYKRGQVLTSDNGNSGMHIDTRTTRDGVVQLYTANNQPTIRQVR
ncbi:kinase-like domain-containing protein [Pisolithus microcarpus]|nr:kinase-like domain-containing protein [Pisolithus microcarpus]